MTIAIVFDRKNNTKKGGLGPLELRMTIERKSYYVPLGIKIKKSEWRNSSIVNRYDADELNERLRIVTTKVEKEVNRLLANNLPIVPKDIKSRLFITGSASSSAFMDWAKSAIEIMPLAPGTIKHYHTLLLRLTQFGMIKSWSDINTDMIMRWDAWLHNVKKPLTDAQKAMGIEPEHIGDAAIYNYHKNLKRLLNIAERDGKLERNPYSKMHGIIKRYHSPDIIKYLTEDEMQKIIDAPIQRGSHLDIVRDLFVIQMFTGMAYTDMQKFDISKYKLVNGRWIANEQRVKTGVAFISQLLPPVVERLEKYGWEIPKITNQVYNRSLKMVQEIAGIEARLHSHLARHTFATYMLSHGVSIDNLQRMMGHTQITMTQKYAKTLAASVHDDFDMIADKLAKKKSITEVMPPKR